jgi:hypothetical protein
MPRLKVLYRFVVGVTCVVAVYCRDSGAAEPARAFDIDLRWAHAGANMTGPQCDEKLSALLAGKPVHELKYDVMGYADMPAAPAIYEAYQVSMRERDSQARKIVDSSVESDGRIAGLAKRVQELTARLQSLQAVPRPTSPVREEFEPKDKYAQRLREYESQVTAYRPTDEAINSAQKDLATANDEHARLLAKARSAGDASAQNSVPKDSLRFVFAASVGRYDIDSNCFDVACQDRFSSEGIGGQRRAPAFVDKVNFGPFVKWVENGFDGKPGISIRCTGKLNEAIATQFRITGFHDIDEAKAFKAAVVKGGLSYIVEVGQQPWAGRWEEPPGKAWEDQAGVHGTNKPSRIIWDLKLAPKHKDSGTASASLTGPALSKSPHLTVTVVRKPN